MPLEQYDDAPNDVCFAPLESRTEVPLLDNLNFTTVTIDSRMKNISSNYSYSVSVWLKYQGPKIMTSSSTFNQTTSFLLLKGVFTLWFQNFSNGTYARFRLHSNKSNNEKDTPGLFIPLDEWINIQLNFN